MAPRHLVRCGPDPLTSSLICRARTATALEGSLRLCRGARWADDDLTHAGTCRRASPCSGGRLAVAVAAYLARFKGLSRQHTESDLRSFLTRCQERDLDPFLGRRKEPELYLRWMQETRRFKPPTVSRRTPV